MAIYLYYKDDNHKITLWEKTDTYCIVQEYHNGKRSKKAKSVIKYYNEKPYIICKGHRYYLDDFIKCEL